MAPESERSAKLWNRLAKRYAAAPVKHEDDYRKKLEIMRGYLKPGMEVFELGCGTGSTAIEHAPHVEHIHATDYSSDRLVRIAPFVNLFSQPEPEAMLTDAGFQIDHMWRPGKNKAAFIVAKKPDPPIRP